MMSTVSIMDNVSTALQEIQPAQAEHTEHCTTMRASFDVEESLWRRVRASAVLADVSTSEYVAAALRRALEEAA